ncbi:MAG TPA: hypothetical protein VMZ28_03840 [Kofleriaceae bacterium]|nr:hypothetical protein [Kofleriaceae bacterium]
MEGGGEAGGEAGGGMEEGDGGGDMAMAPAPKMRLGAAAAFVLPIGDWGDISGIGIGVLGRFAYMVSPKLAVLAQPGYIHHLDKDMFSTREMLLLLGARFMVTPEIGVGGDIGYVSLKGCFDGTCGDSQGRIPLNIGAEYTMASGLYAGASLFIPNLLLKDSDLDEKTLMGIMANVGYTIGL